MVCGSLFGEAEHADTCEVGGTLGGAAVGAEGVLSAGHSNTKLCLLQAEGRRGSCVWDPL